jgi:D-glycero-alpha-D-manno-heptose-7-phosphate kinase
MIISRTPYRVSFIGGGTDLPEFYRVDGGAAVNCAIDKYVYVIVTKNFHKVWKVSYSKTEYANSIDEIQHPIVRETLRYTGIEEPLDIVTASDMPSGSGIGSSSAFTVGLLHALSAYKKIDISKERLARTACLIEMGVDAVGKQDQYASAYGGLNFMRFNKDNTVEVERLEYPWEMVLGQSLLLMFTGDTRKSSDIQAEVKRSVKNKILELNTLKDMAENLHSQMLHNCPPTMVAHYLSDGWALKRSLAPNVSNQRIEQMMVKAVQNGAIGGKLLGAGGDGFMLFYCAPNKQQTLMDAFPDMQFVMFMIDNDGSRIIYRG